MLLSVTASETEGLAEMLEEVELARLEDVRVEVEFWTLATAAARVALAFVVDVDDAVMDDALLELEKADEDAA